MPKTDPEHMKPGWKDRKILELEKKVTNLELHDKVNKRHIHQLETDLKACEDLIDRLKPLACCPVCKKRHREPVRCDPCL